MGVISEPVLANVPEHKVIVIKKSTFSLEDVQIVANADFLGWSDSHGSAHEAPGWVLEGEPDLANKLEKSVATLQYHLDRGDSVYGQNTRLIVDATWLTYIQVSTQALAAVQTSEQTTPKHYRLLYCNF